ncbi:hypothetical protein Pelo_10634 [Pelomyxa schiedti]|nr:hypothetical protein Pelo_10634 [Pelomyxa schiedti]
MASHRGVVGDQRRETNTAIKLTLHGKRLPKMDSGLFSKSDPFFVIKHPDTNTTVYRSEVIMKTLDPEWAEFTLWLHEVGGPSGTVKIECWDWDADGSFDYMGYATVEVRMLVEVNRAMDLVNKKGKREGQIVVAAATALVTPIPPDPPAYSFSFRAKNLEKKDGPLGKSDPFFVITLSNGDVLFKSEIIRKSLDPTWAPFELDVRELPSGWNTEITITIFDFDDDGDCEEIGRCTTPLNLLKFPFPYTLVNPSKKKLSGNSGLFYVNSVTPVGSLALLSADPYAWTFKVTGSGLKKDLLSKRLDPFFVLSTKTTSVYRSEICQNTSTPSWAAFTLPSSLWNSSPKEPLKVDVYTFDTEGSHKLIGSTLVSTWMLFRWPNKNASLKHGSSSTGNLIFENLVQQTTFNPPYDSTAEAFEITSSARKLSIPGSLEKADPFFEVRVGNELLYRSEHISNNNNPDFTPFTLSVKSVNGLFGIFSLIVYDWEKRGDHRIIGKYSTTLYELLIGGPFQYPLHPSTYSPSGPLLFNYENSSTHGTLCVNSITPVAPGRIPAPPAALELYCSCENLVRANGPLGSCDPFFTVSILSSKVHKSEVVTNSLNPTFKPFSVSLASGLETVLVIQVFDYNKDGDHELLGEVRCLAKELTFGWYSTAIMHNGSTSGCFSISKVAPLPEVPFRQITVPPAVRMQCYARKLPVCDTLTMSVDPFFEVKKNNIILYRSEAIPKQFTPAWAEFVLPLHLLTSASDSFTIDVYDKDNDGTHDHIGGLTVPFSELQWSWFEQVIKKGSTCNGSFGIKNTVPCEAPPPIANIPAIELHCSIGKLERAGAGIKKSDAFFELFAPHKVYRSEVVKQSSSPKFHSFTLDLACGLETTLTFKVYDWEIDGDHELLGSFSVTVREISLGWFTSAIHKSDGGTAGSFSIDQVLHLPKAISAPFSLPPAINLACFARRLPVMDVATMSADPFFVIHKMDPNIHQEITLYRSEVIHKSREPKWKPFDLPLSLFRSIDDTIDITVYDWEKSGNHELVGHSSIVFRDLQWWVEPGIKKDGAVCGCFVVETVTPLTTCPALVIPTALRVTCSAHGLARMDGPTGLSDPFFVVEKNSIPVYRSEIHMKTLQPTWAPFDISVGVLGGLDSSFKITVYDYDQDGTHDLIGSLTTTLREWTCSLIQSDNGPYQQAVFQDGSSKGSFSVDKLEIIPSGPALPIFAPSYRLEVCGDKIAKLDVSATGMPTPSDPFFVVKVPFRDTHIPIYRSEVINKSTQPVWNSFVLDTTLIKTLDAQFYVEVWDFDKDGTHDLVGECKITLRDWCLGPFRHPLLASSSRSRGAFVCNKLEPLTFSPEPLVIPPAIKLYCSAYNLIAKDGPLGKSDPFFSILGQPPGSSKNVTIYRSEVVKKELNPIWSPCIINIADVKGIDSQIEINIYDWDANGAHDTIGRIKICLRDVMIGPFRYGIPCDAVLTTRKSNGAFCIDKVEAVPEPVSWPVFASVEVSASATKLAARDLNGKSDPYFVVSASPPGCNAPVTLYRSEVIHSNLNPTFKAFALNLKDLKNADTEFTVSVWDWDTDGGHDLIGSARTTLREWLFTPYLFSIHSSSSSISCGGFSVDKITLLTQEYVRPSFESLLIQASAMKLASRDPSGSSDPFFVVKAKPTAHHKKITLFRSEIIHSNKEPVWKPFGLNLCDVINIDTRFTIAVWDWDADGGHDLIGKAKVSLREFFFLPYQFGLYTKGSSVTSGAFSVNSVTPQNQPYTIPTFGSLSVEASAAKLRACDISGSSDPFFVIKATPPGMKKPITIYRSEVMLANKNPIWKPFALNYGDFTDLDTKFTVTVWDWDADGTHDMIGKFETTLREWLFIPFQFGLYSPSSPMSAGAFSVDRLTFNSQPIIKPRFSSVVIKTSAAKLAFRDINLSSDPYFILRGKPTGYSHRVILYRSEVIHRTTSPSWGEFSLNLADITSEDKKIIVEVFDSDLKGSHDIIGSAKTTLREWLFTPCQFAVKSSGITSSSGAFSVDKVVLSDVVIPKQIPLAIQVTASAHHLPVCDISLSSDPFFEVYGTLLGKQKILIHRSSVVHKNLNPSWEPFLLDITSLGGVDSHIKIKVFDWDSNGHHDLIGNMKVTFRELLLGPWQYGLSKKSSNRQGSFCIDNVVPVAPPPPQVVPIAVGVSLALANAPAPNLPHATEEEYFFEVHNHTKLLFRSSRVTRKDPSWKEFTLNVADIGGLDDNFSVRVFKFSQIGAHISLGSISTTLRHWTFGPYRHHLLERMALCIEEVHPVTQVFSLPYFPAYRLSSFALHLAAKDANGKSDPFFVLYMKSNEGKRTHVPIYRSEVVPKNCNPSWKSYDIEAREGHNTYLEVEVYDWDADGGHDLIGKAGFRVHDLLFGDFRIPLEDGSSNKGGFCFSNVEGLPIAPEKNYSVSYQIKFGISHLQPRKGKGVFLEVFKDPKLIYRSEVIFATQARGTAFGGTWSPFQIDLEDFGSPESSLRFRVSHYSTNGAHKEVGGVELMLIDLLCGGFSFPLTSATGIQISDSNAAFCLEEISPLSQAKCLFFRNGEPTNEPPPAFGMKFSAAKLSSKDANGKSDPFFKIVTSVTIFRSEVITKNLNPEWKSFQVNLADLNGLDGVFTVIVYDWDADGSHEQIGNVKLTLRDLVYNDVTVPLKGEVLGRNSGGLTIRKLMPIENTTTSILSAPAFKITVSGRKLAAKDLSGKSDPFFIFFAEVPVTQLSPAGSTTTRKQIPLYRSEVILKSLNPTWAPFVVNTSTVPVDKSFGVSVFDADADGSHDLIGSLTSTLREWSFGNVQEALYTDNALTTSGCFSIDQVTPLQMTVPELPVALRITCGGVALKKTRLTGSAAPYFEVFSHLDADRLLLHRSKPSPDNSWAPFDISPIDVGGWDTPFSIKCHNRFKDGTSDLIGQFQITLRECLFTPFTYAVKPESISVSSSAGGFRLLSSEHLTALPQLPTYAAFSIQPKGIKLDTKSDTWFEIHMQSPGQPAVLVHRSELVDGTTPDWKPFKLWPSSFASTLTTCFFKVCVYSFKNNVRTQIGKARYGYRDMLFGLWSGTLINKKRSHIPMYTNSGCLQLDISPLVNAPPEVYNASAYRLSCRVVVPSSPESLSGGDFKIIGISSTGAKSHILRTPFFPDQQLEITIPFEGIHSLETPLDISIPHCKDIHTNLRNLSYVGVCSSAKVHSSSTHSRPSHVYLVVDSCAPLLYAITGYQIQFSASELPRSDDLVGLCDPFLQLIKEDTNTVIASTEVHTQDLAPVFAPVCVNIMQCGGMDSPIKLAIYDYDPGGAADFLGGCTTTLRELSQEQPLPGPFILIDEEKKSKLTTYTHSGTLTVKVLGPVTAGSPLGPPHSVVIPQHLAFH